MLSNAIKYTPEDGEVKLKFFKSFNDNTEHVIIEIEDTGQGMDPESLPHIFDRFYQVESKGKQKTIGTGVGLDLVKELVDLMGGNITVQSVLGKGSEFRIMLPVTNLSEVSQEYEQEQQTSISQKISVQKQFNLIDQEKPVLLLIEDNEELMNYLVSILEKDYTLECSIDGSEGVTKAEKLIPDLIISDIVMPNKDGLQLCRELKENEITSHIPIVLLTGKSEFEDRIKGLETGADAYIVKPFKKEELFIRLQKLNKLRLKLQKKYSNFALVESTDVSKKDNSFIIKINSIIENNLLNEEFNIETLAKEVFMSRMQLHRKLKALANRSASNYIRNYRLYKARPMLKDLSRTVSDVAWDVGFQDPNYFSKIFQNEFGITPSEFRNK